MAGPCPPCACAWWTQSTYPWSMTSSSSSYTMTKLSRKDSSSTSSK